LFVCKLKLAYLIIYLKEKVKDIFIECFEFGVILIDAMLHLGAFGNKIFIFASIEA